MSVDNRLALNIESLGSDVEDEHGLEALIEQARKGAGRRLGEMLLERGYIGPADLNNALRETEQPQAPRLGEWLVKQQQITGQQITELLSEQFGIARIRLRNFQIRPEIVAIIPDRMALEYEILPLAIISGALIVATADPFDDQALSNIRFFTGRTIHPLLASTEDIGQALHRYYASEAADQALEELNFSTPASNIDGAKDPSKPDYQAEIEGSRKPVVRLVNAIIMRGIHEGASDINIRPTPDRINIYHRVDGKLHLARTLDRGLLAALVARIKIIAGMNIAERRLPQDGNARVSKRNHPVDLRMSVIPTVNGESVVIRILDKQRGVRPLKEIGFQEKDHAWLVDFANRAQGMFLVTGPTGSGKTTTLYAMLSQIARRECHTITVEDPVEYQLEGMEQIQVNNHIGYDFARALRHILRHDPDVIMVGEIRDTETARIATQAALTGHLMLSTLHTNEAAGTIGRLLDMGIEPYLLSSTLLGVIAQRLIRLNCPRCLEVETVDPHVAQSLNVHAGEVFYRGSGCEQCHHTGFKGRTVIYELLVNSPEVASLIRQGAPSEEIFAGAVNNGMRPMSDHALQLAREKRTALQEVFALRNR
ncbi:MAG: GspE/PulE family protein [Pseudomonadota bacterium]|nr:GspE/PulE family protein [Pseudomonadota bacterium]